MRGAEQHRHALSEAGVVRGARDLDAAHHVPGLVQDTERPRASDGVSTRPAALDVVRADRHRRHAQQLPVEAWTRSVPSSPLVTYARPDRRRRAAAASLTAASAGRVRFERRGSRPTSRSPEVIQTCLVPGTKPTSCRRNAGRIVPTDVDGVDVSRRPRRGRAPRCRARPRAFVRLRRSRRASASRRGAGGRRPGAHDVDDGQVGAAGVRHVGVPAAGRGRRVTRLAEARRTCRTANRAAASPRRPRCARRPRSPPRARCCADPAASRPADIRPRRDHTTTTRTRCPP
jgi:hypothetical protein